MLDSSAAAGSTPAGGLFGKLRGMAANAGRSSSSNEGASTSTAWYNRRSAAAPSPGTGYLPLPVSLAGSSTSSNSGDLDSEDTAMRSQSDLEEYDEKEQLQLLLHARNTSSRHRSRCCCCPESRSSHSRSRCECSACPLHSSLSSSSSNSSDTGSDSSTTWSHHQHHASSSYPPSSLARLCSPSSPSKRNTRGGCGCIILSIVQLAILGLAVIGIAGIVALATGLLQRTPIYSEKALQDSGWTRRPISVPATSHQAGSSSSSNGGGGAVTIHDFTPSLPGLVRGEHQTTLSASSSSFQAIELSSSSSSPTPMNELHLLILCPLRNAASDLPRLFSLLDTFTHPFSNTSLGFLVGDENDDTGNVLRNLVEQRMEKEERRYRHVSLLHKDFKVQMPSGANRHSYLLQSQRRTVMARARTYLLTATLEPTVDWVLWLDSDVAELSPSLFQDLLIYGNAGVELAPDSPLSPALSAHSSSLSGMQGGEWNDIIVPNAMKRLPNGELHGFDMNNWQETPESLKLKAELGVDDLLIEGNIWQHMHRLHLADFYTSYLPSSSFPSPSPSSSSSANSSAAVPQIFSSLQVPSLLAAQDQRLNVSSKAYIGTQFPLDGIGGVAALVRAEVHRMGATFPSWVFENQLETEAFGVLAKKLGARIVGLPNLFVLHKS